jgi:hypothetical protein
MVFHIELRVVERPKIRTLFLMRIGTRDAVGEWKGKPRMGFRRMCLEGKWSPVCLVTSSVVGAEASVKGSVLEPITSASKLGEFKRKPKDSMSIQSHYV